MGSVGRSIFIACDDCLSKNILAQYIAHAFRKKYSNSPDAEMRRYMRVDRVGNDVAF